MHNHGHTLVGLGGGIALASFEPTVYGQGLAVIGALAGASAPDWLEIWRKREVNGRVVRTPIIPHRTFTHWLLPWLFLVGYAFHLDAVLLQGFAIAGVLHLASDFPNKMGIPLINPFGRKCLGWWPSGTFDVPLGVSAVLLGLSFWYP